MKLSLRISLLLPLILPLPAAHAQFASSSIRFSAHRAEAMFSQAPPCPSAKSSLAPTWQRRPDTMPTPAGMPRTTFAASARPTSAAPAAAPNTETFLSCPPPAPSPLDSTSPRADEHASAGLYSVKLARYDIGVEITAARRAPSTVFITRKARTPICSSTSATASSPALSRAKRNSSPVRSQILSPTEVAGSTSVTGGWNKQPNTYTVYFYAR